jgi:hypothetical protein
VHVRALLTNAERWDQLLDREPNDDERNSDQQARARLVLHPAHDMFLLVDGKQTTFDVLEELRASNLWLAYGISLQIMSRMFLAVYFKVIYAVYRIYAPYTVY